MPVLTGNLRPSGRGGCQEDQFNRAEAECQAIAEKLAQLLAAVPGPIEVVDVIPWCQDSNLAEVKVQRTSQEEGQ